jgi:hypothetical protein
MSRRLDELLPSVFFFAVVAVFLAVIGRWLATLGGVGIPIAIPVVVATVWGIHRKDGVFVLAFLLVVSICAFVARTQGY